MSTKKLAKELGLLRQRSQSSSASNNVLLSNQIFSYLIVIDFESTCWKDKNNYSQEIIEFPAVLLNTSSGQTESEFHTYVQPQEHPALSAFCTELTGISQGQVEAGVPLHICLSRFSRWLQNLQLQMGVVFPSMQQQKCSTPSASQNLCAFLTWSDWDLGVCLQYECRRKQLHKPAVLSSWIDLRRTYRLFYNRKPRGLNGALQDIGIQFSGREHSGLDDARNTAKLAAKMMRDGCVMKITKSLERTPTVVRVENPDDSEGNHHQNIKDNTLTCKVTPRSETTAVSVNMKPLVLGSVQNLVSPRTLLRSDPTTSPMWGHGRWSLTNLDVADDSSVVLKSSSPYSVVNESLVLCSTTLGCLSHPPPPKGKSKTDATAQLERDDSEELSVETEERCGSYDDVVLGSEDSVTDTGGERSSEFLSDGGTGSRLEEESQLKSPGRTGDGNHSQVRHLSVNTVRKCRAVQFNRVPEGGVCFAVPQAVSFDGVDNKTSPQSRRKSQQMRKNDSKTSSPLVHGTSIPGKTSTPNPFSEAVRLNLKPQQTPRTSFTVYSDPVRFAPVSRTSLNPANKVLSALSANTHSSFTNRSFSETARVRKVTSPLCACGRRAKRQVVCNGGPNQGRGFFCCPVRRSGSCGKIQKGCDFFKWESSLMKSSGLAPPAALASVSLSHNNSTFSCGLQQRATLR